MITFTNLETNPNALLPKVYFIKTIDSESLIKAFDALQVIPQGNVAVKISTGEAGGHNYLKPKLISGLVDKVNGTIVECNTAYQGKRNFTVDHWKTIKDHGFDKIAKVDILDEVNDMEIPTLDTTHIKCDYVGDHLRDYDFLIDLAHAKGHAMAGFGGVLKNIGIGCASGMRGKTYIHTAGERLSGGVGFDTKCDQDDFLESICAAAQAVSNYFNGRIVYMNVMNNISKDCDCDSHPADPKIKDIGIAASLDPIALDQFFIDKVKAIEKTDDNDPTEFLERLQERNGEHILEYGEKIRYGSRKYEVIEI